MTCLQTILNANGSQWKRSSGTSHMYRPILYVNNERNCDVLATVNLQRMNNSRQDWAAVISVGDTVATVLVDPHDANVNRTLVFCVVRRKPTTFLSKRLYTGDTPDAAPPEVVALYEEFKTEVIEGMQDDEAYTKWRTWLLEEIEKKWHKTGILDVRSPKRIGPSASQKRHSGN